MVRALNIVEDRNIQLTYLIEGNRFKVALLPIEQNPKFNTSSTTNPTTMYHAQSSNQVLAATTFNPVINNIDSLDYNFHGGYQWEKIVTAAQASHKKRQTLYIPRETVRPAIGYKETLRLTKCKIVTATRYNHDEEKHLTTGWYTFIRENNINRGDKLIFTFNRTQTIMRVQIVRPPKK
ncbi:hypothetical protein QL285_036204 [Trifolium repens]|nr:hypothetical protein QL285_098209 [Trifolium repens]KAK2413496.1 hypothetical protein QL285_036200 [Trifolium repens]KAK2413498.1 hypothetical protein QL285_036202 [Trifolium repens]KAK2413501.1 hypothetical protein QL285_036204 [Trifolium repens]